VALVESAVVMESYGSGVIGILSTKVVVQREHFHSKRYWRAPCG